MPDSSLVKLGIIAFCSMICEGAMFDWSGVYFFKVIHPPKGLVAAGYTAFMATMASGRFVGDWLATKWGIKRILQASGTLTASGLLPSDPGGSGADGPYTGRRRQAVAAPGSRPYRGERYGVQFKSLRLGTPNS